MFWVCEAEKFFPFLSGISDITQADHTAKPEIKKQNKKPSPPPPKHHQWEGKNWSQLYLQMIVLNSDFKKPQNFWLENK